MSVSIVILTKNGGNKFEKLMEKLSNQSYNDFEIVIIDSGSTDKTLEIAEKYGCRIYRIKPKEFHHSKTRNLGAELARGRNIVYITQDALPLHDEFLERLTEPLEDYEIAGVYGRQIAYSDAKPMEKFFYSYFYPNERKVITPAELKNLVEFYVSHAYISNVCSAIKKEVWEKIRFDENIIMAEDKKWAIDVLRAGYKLVYEPKAAVYHSHNYSIISVFKRRFDDGVAMKQICGSGRVALKSLSYFVSEIKYLMKYHGLWLPYAMIYNFARFTGFGLGNYYEYIPNTFRRRMSKHEWWWTK